MFFKIITKTSRSVQKVTKISVSKLLENSQYILDNLQENYEHQNLCKIPSTILANLGVKYLTCYK